MKKNVLTMNTLALLVMSTLPGFAAAFSSGSTGADGAFNPTINTEVVLPESGVLNYSSINIPAGVKVTFKSNTTNTPVVLLVGGDATIAGTIDVSGNKSADSGTAGNGNQGDDGLPGKGGPGGFDGGRGGKPNGLACSTLQESEKTRGGPGIGPGAGSGGRAFKYSTYCISGGAGGGGYNGAGQGSYVYRNPSFVTDNGGTFGAGGDGYGSNLVLPLIGGSGAGGGSGGIAFAGSGGGGGGGALLIAATGTVHITGSILAKGGDAGSVAGQGQGGPGGGGAGGGVRIVATTISGNGTINAAGGGRGYLNVSGTMTNSDTIYSAANNSAAGNGANGRIRLEAETLTYSASTTPAYTKDAPGSVFVAGLPTLTIASVAGVTAPVNPTGNADISLPADTQNPVTVTFQTTNVPLGNTVLLTVTPAYGEKIIAQSPALTGSTASGSASVQVSLPSGPSVLQATTTYTIVASLGDALSTYANNERVEKIQLMAGLGGSSSMVKLITVSGKEFTVPMAALAAMGA